MIFDFLDATVYVSYILDKPQLPTYPLDFRCVSSSETLLSCVYNSINLSPYAEVEISCASQEPGEFFVKEGILY